MIDIHTHILFDIDGDDGSRSKEMTVEMLRMAADSGTTHMIATPHVNRNEVIPDWLQIKERVEEVNELAVMHSIPVQIYTGGEVQLDYNIMRELSGNNDTYCLAGSRYILVELTSQSDPSFVEEMLFELMLRGYLPILAHPERYDRIIHHPEVILKWMNKGLYTQCNTGSFYGYFGERVQKRVQMLYNHQMITFLGSDAHRIAFRTTDTREAQYAIEKLTGSDLFWKQCSDHAKYILNKDVYYPEVPESFTKKKKGFFAQLFS